MALNLDTLGLSATVTAEGISAPDYQTILDTLMSYFQQIYGSDAYLEPDSKDGQMVALVALAIHDANNTAISVYNCFSPATGYGAALTSNVKINGIARRGATNSTVDLVLTGTAGTSITNGTVKDTNNVIWRLPASVTIGVGGTVTVTATCSNSGAVAALAGTITTINTPTRGWASVTNPAAATVGAPAETDAELRIRQGQSVALPSLTPFEGVDGAIANVAGVTRHKLYENDTGATDSNGLPPHSISAIVDGGDVTEIAQTIRGNKGQGTATYGTTSVTVPDTYGNPHVIYFSRSTDVPIYGHITLKAFTGYTSQIGVQIQQAVADYINGLTIGDDVLLSRIYSPANLGVVSGGNARYYDIQELLIGKSAGSVAAANIIIAYNESASCKPENIVLTVTS
ncbi:baseplate J/gp47 family protein [Enterobacter asburiae]|uniref:baseplate J/gp47 family protein n=1 Tax=Enterobacter asburiae TaxID=61645 RepID=UPI0015E59A3F|nr:baseplate J/gp47 family protein [Enterobacter asburiae]QLO48683.1 baseplate J/gp47 family protein [Enterobacter cloacae]QLR29941.1 baseplate J/gp47 family protein [Enterobacter asburiae]HDR2644054.1 baseplate J/gp47 family protein [Enterobacter asburiae]HDS5465567.1 baseplate J/gp47 family protein [Enterobacter asburiae]HDS6856466.1 baseplate J/gp47 family protein [Enterobacter asburiae]